MAVDQLKTSQDQEIKNRESGGILIEVPEAKKTEKQTVSVDRDEAPRVETPGPSTYQTDPHEHDGVDAPRVNERNLRMRTERIHIRLDGATPATAANYGVFFSPLDTCFVRAVYERHTTAGSDGSDVGLNIEKLTGTTAPDSGTEILSADINLKGTANTLAQGSLVPSRSARTLRKGDALCLKDSGTLTAVAGLYLLVEVEYI